MDPDTMEHIEAEENENENENEVVDMSQVDDRLEDPEDHRFCYLCNENILTNEYFYHLLQYHPITLSVMASLYFPDLETDEVFPFLVHSAVDSLVDQMDYGSLQELCDMIGYHKIGIQDITTVSTVKDNTELMDDDTCPICMDLLQEKETVYIMNVCSHLYCKECIETWVSENKTCPVCKTDLQISSMSKDSSDSYPVSDLEKPEAGPPPSPS